MDTLPSEIKSIVVSHLDSRSLRALRLANTQWFNKVRYCDFVFNFTTEERVPQIIQRLSKYNYPIGLTFEKSRCILAPNDYEEIGGLTQLTKLMFGLIIENHEPDAVLAPLTNLTNLLEIDHRVHPHIIRHLTKLNSIVITDIVDAQRFDLARFKNLRNVIWTSYNEDICAEDLMLACISTIQTLRIDIINNGSEELDLNFPHLTKLHLNCLEWSFNLSKLPNIERIFINAGRINGLAQLQTLTSLIIFSQTTNFDELTGLTRLKVLSIQWPEYSVIELDRLHFLTALTNLESFAMGMNGRDVITESHFDRGLQFIHSTKLTHLEYLHISADYFNRAKFDRLRSLEAYLCEEAVLEQLLHLTKLNLANIDPHSFDAIEKLTELRSLELSPSEVSNNSKRKLKISMFRNLQDLRYFPNASAKARDYLNFRDTQDVPLKSIRVDGADDSFLEMISGVTALESLSLSRSLISCNNTLLHLTNMANLTHLYIARANKAGTNLTRLTSLQELVYYGDTLEPEELKQKLTKLHYLANK